MELLGVAGCSAMGILLRVSRFTIKISGLRQSLSLILTCYLLLETRSRDSLEAWGSLGASRPLGVPPWGLLESLQNVSRDLSKDLPGISTNPQEFLEIAEARGLPGRWGPP